MGEMRDSDWSRPNLLRSDWLPIIGAIMTTNNNFLIVIFLTENLPILNPCYPQNPKIYDPILVTLLKMLPHPAENPH